MFFFHKFRFSSQYFYIDYSEGMCGMKYSQQEVSSTLDSFEFRDEEAEDDTDDEVRVIRLVVLILFEPHYFFNSYCLRRIYDRIFLFYSATRY